MENPKDESKKLGVWKFICGDELHFINDEGYVPKQPIDTECGTYYAYDSHYLDLVIKGWHTRQLCDIPENAILVRLNIEALIRRNFTVNNTHGGVWHICPPYKEPYTYKKKPISAECVDYIVIDGEKVLRTKEGRFEKNKDS